MTNVPRPHGSGSLRTPPASTRRTACWGPWCPWCRPLNIALKLGRRYLRTTKEMHGDRFFVVENGVRYATPLLLVLLVVEFTDLLFAVDSVPAVLAISNDIFVVYTSNVMAILGLRALYFMLAGMMNRFHHLGTGLALILIFIGAKMVASPWIKVPSTMSLIVIFVLLSGAVTLSLVRKKGVT
jgi:tellurite resistance protein TerC